MAKRSKKSSHSVPDYTKVCHSEPPLYNIMILYTPQVLENEFEEMTGQCLNCDSSQSQSLYSELKKKQHIKYGIYTKDVAETIAGKIKSLSAEQNCCAIKIT